jgi:hypothetical protein
VAKYTNFYAFFGNHSKKLTFHPVRWRVFILESGGKLLIIIFAKKKLLVVLSDIKKLIKY